MPKTRLKFKWYMPFISSFSIINQAGIALGHKNLYGGGFKMKLGISSSGEHTNSNVDMRFGRCSFFAIYDTDTNTAQFIQNPAQSASGGAGIAAAQAMIDNDVEAVITGNVGPNAFNVFANSDIKVYRCASVPVDNAVRLFLESKLEEINQAGPAHAGMGR